MSDNQEAKDISIQAPDSIINQMIGASLVKLGNSFSTVVTESSTDESGGQLRYWSVAYQDEDESAVVWVLIYVENDIIRTQTNFVVQQDVSNDLFLKMYDWVCDHSQHLRIFRSEERTLVLTANYMISINTANKTLYINSIIDNIVGPAFAFIRSFEDIKPADKLIEHN